MILVIPVIPVILVILVIEMQAVEKVLVLKHWAVQLLNFLVEAAGAEGRLRMELPASMQLEVLVERNQTRLIFGLHRPLCLRSFHHFAHAIPCMLAT